MMTISVCFAVLWQLRSIRWSVPGSVLLSLVTSRPEAAGLWYWHPAVPSQPASVGDELSCPASVRLVEV